MTTSESYKGEFTSVPADVSQIIQSRTFYTGDKGDEIADFSHNYGQLSGGAWDVKSTSFFYYGADKSRATAAAAEDAMTLSESYIGSKGAVCAITEPDPLKLSSKTYYQGIKGDEIADYSHNFKYGTTTIKTTSFFLYNGDRADRAAAEAAMTTSESYKGEFTSVPADVSQIIQSRTFYTGDKGDEIADFSHNYGQLSGGAWDVKSTSFFYYGADKSRATAAAAEDAMTLSESYIGSKGAVCAITEPDPLKLSSKTYYQGIKGDEIADYSHNFKYGTTTIKTTSFFLYNGDRADRAAAEAAMTTSESYKGEFTSVPADVSQI